MFIVLFLLISCDPLEWDDSCYEEKPEEGLLYLKVTCNNDHDSVPVAVYEGKIEAGKLLFRDTVYNDTISYWLPVNTYYTASATYKENNETVVAIAGGEIRTILNTDDSDASDCWQIHHVSLNLKLK